MSKQGNIILGIDPGLSGGLAFRYSNGDIEVEYPPIFKEKVAGKKNKNRRHIDPKGLGTLLRKYSLKHAFIEKQQAMPKQGVSSTFRTGLGYGIYIGILATLLIPFTEIRARIWKQDMVVPADKDGALLRASELMPKYVNLWPLKKDNGVAEAALIALWGERFGNLS